MQTETQTPRKRVIVVGAGFGGLSAARTLGESEVDVLVLDRSNYHGFWPLLYQVATAGLEPEAIAYPIRAILRRYPNTDFQLAEVTAIDFNDKKVVIGQESLDYDYLVVAAGSTTNYFGKHELAEHSFGLKDLQEAVKLRNQILRTFEKASHESDPARRTKLMTFVIVGGGPTGVELSGAFSELIHEVLRKDYPMLDINQARIILVESSPSLLAAFPSGLQRTAQKQLKKMQVEVRLHTAVTAIHDSHVMLKDGSYIESETVIWAAGVRAAMLTDKLNISLGKGARVPIKPTLNLTEHPEVFVIGDMAYLEGYKENQAYPQVAQVALQQGKQAALNILATLRQQPLQTFHYFDKGTMATIGRRAAVMDAFGIRISGFLAWLGWLLVHLFFLIGFRNRLVVLANWAYNYFTYDRGTRLISSEGEGW